MCMMFAILAFGLYGLMALAGILHDSQKEKERRLLYDFHRLIFLKTYSQDWQTKQTQEVSNETSADQVSSAS